MLKREGFLLRLINVTPIGLPMGRQLLFTKLVLTDLKEVTGEKSRYGITTAQLSSGGPVDECLRLP